MTGDGKLLLVCKLKGGAGATTTCRELSAAAQAAGLSVALIDLDGQAGLSRWWNRRTAGEATFRSSPDLLHLSAAQIPSAAKALRTKYDLVIIDSPPSVHETIGAVARVVDLALIPSRPTVDDLDAVGPIVRLLHGIVDQAFVLTQVPPARGSRDGAEALELLASRAPVLGRTTFRADYSRPPARGGTGFEEAATAQQEIGALWTRISERLDITLSRDDGVMVEASSIITAAGD
jgi:chromosome partitioning protein